MSKNRNRAKLRRAVNSREYTKMMKIESVYCRICGKRGGGYDFSCYPSNLNPKGWRWRINRSWKNNRKTQWKEK
jgi:hypothetical protein